MSSSTEQTVRMLHKHAEKFDAPRWKNAADAEESVTILLQTGVDLSLDEAALTTLIEKLNKLEKDTLGKLARKHKVSPQVRARRALGLDDKGAA